MASIWNQRLERQLGVLKEGRGHLVVIASYGTGGPEPKDEPYVIEGQTATMSEEFIRKHAYDLGIQNVVYGRRAQCTLAAAGDDSVPGLYIDWGTGATASLFTGREANFQECTSYSTDTVVKRWDDIDKLRFDPENRWVKYELEFWRGVSSAYAEGIAVLPKLYRSPLDLANDLRGNRIFEDMILEPEQVERLIAKCTDMILDADRFFHSQSPVIRQAPSGIWGVALPGRGMLGVNGDPVDLISAEMGERFNHPYIERLIEYGGGMYFHHHTLGISRFRSVAGIAGLTVQQYTDDPKCPRVYDRLDEEWVAASRRATIDVWQNLFSAPDVDKALGIMSRGRFIVHVNAERLSDVQAMVERIRRAEAGN
ncbi:MAG: hypothetical protein NT031_12925 [Planctomycetota bacterium]|nr:hypothetical protein [Planctomycetota bacterium]